VCRGILKYILVCRHVGKVEKRGLCLYCYTSISAENLDTKASASTTFRMSYWLQEVSSVSVLKTSTLMPAYCNLTSAYGNSAVNCKAAIHCAKDESVTISLTLNCTHVFSTQKEIVARRILQGSLVKCYRRPT